MLLLRSFPSTQSTESVSRPTDHHSINNPIQSTKPAHSSPCHHTGLHQTLQDGRIGTHALTLLRLCTFVAPNRTRENGVGPGRAEAEASLKCAPKRSTKAAQRPRPTPPNLRRPAYQPTPIDRPPQHGTPPLVQRPNDARSPARPTTATKRRRPKSARLSPRAVIHHPPPLSIARRRPPLTRIAGGIMNSTTAPPAPESRGPLAAGGPCPFSCPPFPTGRRLPPTPTARRGRPRPPCVGWEGLKRASFGWVARSPSSSSSLPPQPPTYRQSGERRAFGNREALGAAAA